MESENPSGSYVFRASEWERSSTFFRIVFDFILALVDLYALIRKVFWKESCNDDAPTRSKGERTIEVDKCRLKRQDSNDTLMKWLAPARDPNVSCLCDSVWEAWESTVSSALFCAHAKRCARLIVNDSDKSVTNERIANTAGIIKRHAQGSVKFRYMFKSLIQFLDDIEMSDANNLAKFMKALAVKMLKAEDSIILQYSINYMHSFSQKSQTACEKALAALSLFVREGAGCERFLFMGGWRNPRDTHNAGLTLLVYFSTPTVVTSSELDINVEEFSNIDRIFLLPKDRPFFRYASRGVPKTNKKFKAMIMYDISLNFSNEYIASSWSNEEIERAVWGLQYGLKHFDRETYEELQSMNGKHKLDLTGYDPVSLLAFSICGVVYFQGRNECAYKLTGDSHASIVISGSLPKPSIKDLVDLKLLKEVRKGRYAPELFPGRNKYVKATRVGNSLHFIESVRSVTFNATEEQVIC